MWSIHRFLHGIEWIIFHGYLDCFGNHLLEVGLTQNQETMVLWALTTVDSFYFIMVRTHVNRNSLKWHLVEAPVTYGFTQHLRIHGHTTSGVLGWPLDTFVWAVIISWSRLLARVWSGPKCPWIAFHKPIKILSQTHLFRKCLPRDIDACNDHHIYIRNGCYRFIVVCWKLYNAKSCCYLHKWGFLKLYGIWMNMSFLFFFLGVCVRRSFLYHTKWKWCH